MKNKRFHGKIWEEYQLFTLACPHFEELQNTLAKTIALEFKDKNISEIKVLEIGCGPGFTTLVILDSDERAKVTAIDNESIMIEQAKIILKDLIAEKRVELIEDDALEFLKKEPSDSYDVFASWFTLHNFSNEFREKVITEIYRVLKPEWIFINADKYAIDDESKHKASLAWQLQQFQEKYSEIDRPDINEKWTAHYIEDNRSETIMKESKSKNLMKDIGFKEIRTLFRKQMEALIFARK